MFSTSGSLVGLLFEMGGRMHSEIKGKIRWKDRNGETVVEWGLAARRRISLKSLQICLLFFPSYHTENGCFSPEYPCECSGHWCWVSGARRGDQPHLLLPLCPGFPGLSLFFSWITTPVGKGSAPRVCNCCLRCGWFSYCDKANHNITLIFCYKVKAEPETPTLRFPKWDTFAVSYCVDALLWSEQTGLEKFPGSTGPALRDSPVPPTGSCCCLVLAHPRRTRDGQGWRTWKGDIRSRHLVKILLHYSFFK